MENVQLPTAKKVLLPALKVVSFVTTQGVIEIRQEFTFFPEACDTYLDMCTTESACSTSDVRQGVSCSACETPIKP